MPTRPAGRELDALIAEKVMGFCLHEPGFTVDLTSAQRECRRCERMIDERDWCNQRGWSPSTVLDDAWTVAEKCQLFEGGDFALTKANTGNQWRVIGHRVGGLEYYGNYSTADTAPLAICLAALKTLEVT